MAIQGYVQRAINWFQHLKWWCEPNVMCTIWSVLHVNSVATGNFGVYFSKNWKNSSPSGWIIRYSLKFVTFCFLRFCVGDRFFLCENRILCESDYVERQTQLQQQMAQANTNCNNNNNSDYIINRNASKLNESEHNKNVMSNFQEKSNFSNFDVPIHVR